MADRLTKEEFCRRFIERMVSVGGETFDDGGSIREYAEAVAPSYWENQNFDGETPEDCAAADISYWGEDNG